MSKMVGNGSQHHAAQEPLTTPSHHENVGIEAITDIDQLVRRITDLLLSVVVDAVEIRAGHGAVENVALGVRQGVSERLCRRRRADDAPPSFRGPDDGDDRQPGPGRAGQGGRDACRTNRLVGSINADHDDVWLESLCHMPSSCSQTRLSLRLGERRTGPTQKPAVLGACGSVPFVLDSREGRVTSVDETLRRAVVAFRLLGWLWMTLLIVVALATDPGANRAVAGATLILATAWTGVTLWAARRPEVLGSWWFLVADGLVALLVASASFVAGAEDLFHGGYPISWIGVAAYSKGLVGAVIAALILSVHQVVAFAVEGERTIVATTGNVVFVVFAVILGWAFDSLRKNDRLRRQAELRLEEEQAQRARHEERVELANQLHDSVLQTLQVIRLDADDPERVRYLARRQDRELRRLIYAFSQPYEDSFLAALLAARDTVEDLYPVEINVVIRDDAEMDAGLEAVVDATKEALVNAAKHSGADHIDLYAEIGDDGVRVFVRDRGAGFDTSSTERGHGLTYSIENRLRAVGGRVVLASTPGEGTELEISIGGDE